MAKPPSKPNPHTHPKTHPTLRAGPSPAAGSRSGEPLAVALSPADENRILAGIDRFIELVRNVARLKVGADDDTPELADRLIRWWHGRAEKDRPAAEDVAWAIGCAAGDLLYHVLEVRWRKIGRGGSESFCLIGERAGSERIVLTPIDIARDRLAGEPEGFIADYLDDLFADEHIRAFMADGAEG